MKRKGFRKAGSQVSGTGIKIEVEIEVKHRRKDSDKAVRKDSRKGGGKDGRKDNRKTELEEGKGKGLKLSLIHIWKDPAVGILHPLHGTGHRRFHLFLRLVSHIGKGDNGDR